MLRKTMTLLALGLMLAPLAHAQTVDDILAKHYEACGGLAKMKAVNTMRVTGTMTLGPGMESPFTIERKRPGLRRMEFTFQGMTGIQAFDGSRTWSVMPFMGKKDPEVGSDEDNKNALDDSDFDGALVEYKSKGHTIELMGKEPVEGADAFKLKVTKKNGNVEYDYLDAETYLLVKTEAKRKFRGTEMEGTTTFSDYKDVDGLMQPFSMESGAKEMPQKQKFAFTKIEMNVPLDDTRFAVPAGATGGSAPAAAAATDSTKAAPKDGDTKAAAAPDTTKKDTKGKTTKSSGKKKG
jgi:outer membrane lipoprotein-sorting protein